MLGESTSLVRFWATTFSTYIKPARSKKGNRLFTPEDVSNFKTIYHLVKEQGMTLEGAKKRLHDNKEGADRTADVIASLSKIKEQLQEIKELL